MLVGLDYNNMVTFTTCSKCWVRPELESKTHAAQLGIGFRWTTGQKELRGQGPHCALYTDSDIHLPLVSMTQHHVLILNLILLLKTSFDIICSEERQDLQESEYGYSLDGVINPG